MGAEMDAGFDIRLVIALLFSVAALVIWLVAGRLRRGVPATDATGLVFTCSGNNRKILSIFGILGLCFAVLPLTLIFLKYFGADPTLPGAPCYRPADDWIAGSCLLLGFGACGLMLLIDANAYYVRLGSGEITVRGAFSGVRSIDWQDVTGIRYHRSLHIFSVNGVVDGKKKRLWVPYHLGELSTFLDQMNARGFSPCE